MRTRFTLLFLSFSILLTAQEYMPSSGKKILYKDLLSKYTTWADVDNDRDLDLYFSNVFNGNNRLIVYKDTNYITLQEEIITKMGGDSYGSTWADIDNDGDLDAFIYTIFNSKNALFINNANEGFKASEDTLFEIKNNVFVAEFVDMDGDGDPDLYMSETELWDPVLAKTKHNRLYINNGKKGWSEANCILTEINADTRGMSWADFNNDGLEDVFLANFGGNSKLFLNRGNLNFEEVELKNSSSKGANSADWGDIDNDGDLDLAVVFIDGKNILFRNNNGVFEAEALATNSRAKITGSINILDYDYDGQMDLYGTNIEESNGELFLALPMAGNYLGVKLRGDRSNSFGVGAKVAIKSGDSPWQYRTMRSKVACPQPGAYTLHYGLGNNSVVDSIIVYWPSGKKQILTKVKSNQYIVIEEDTDFYTLNTVALNANPNARYKDLSVKVFSSFSQQNKFLTLSILYKNEGVAPCTAEIEMKLNKKLEIIRSFPKHNSDDVRGYTWNVKTVEPGQEGIITMIFNMDQTVNEILGDVIILPLKFDERKNNNTDKIIKLIEVLDQ